jgi:4-diphosphocytidyl-2-C-methyl-D-erythritol kinase
MRSDAQRYRDANMAPVTTSPDDAAEPTDRPTVRLFAPAKLTTSLKVSGTRPDGFHLIEAEMVSLDLFDIVEITPDGDGLSIDGPYAEGIGTGDDNLIRRALAVVGRRAGVHLTKNIPHGGGLGGGSSDAAAILRWAGHLDRHTAAGLGADVPFCLRGGRARVTGIGEIIEPLRHQDRTFTLIMPPFSMSTPEVYRAWDALGGPTSQTNDLEPAARHVDARLAQWHDSIGALCGIEPTLAGSGSTWFVDGDQLAALEPLRDRAASVVVARALDASDRRVSGP